MIRFRDRETGRVATERVFGGDALSALYGRWRPLTDRVLSRATANRIYGWLQRSARSRSKIPEFIRSLGIDAGEAERPVESYRSLDEFFTRRLRAGARPIDREPRHLVSPADARALVIPELGDQLVVKESQVAVAQLVGDANLAARVRGGCAVVFRLAPADCHRFYFPDSGRAGVAREVPGPLHSVHPIALYAGAPSFRNKRAISSLFTAEFGELLLVEIGALCVGTIVQTYAAGDVGRGDEKGYFRFGGSTVVLLAEPGRVAVDDDLIRDTADGLETLVKSGTRIGRVA